MNIGEKNECEMLLLNTDRTIKSLKYQINTIVSNKSCHTEISQINPTIIEVIENTPIYARISL